MQSRNVINQESTMHIGCVVGARPNFMKIAPILRELERIEGIQSTLIHTGQHYDKNLSDVFFDDLSIRRPDISLRTSSGSHARQTADVMVAIEQVLLDSIHQGSTIDRLIVVGDVNSTLAATLAASKLNIPVAHVEAGLRSRDRSMPEEINRIVTDSLSDLLFCSEPSAVENLRNEGHPAENIHLVGNVMIDTLLQQLERAKKRKILKDLGLQPGGYGVVTLHRPGNVDAAEVLLGLLQVVGEMAKLLPMVFPIHPRTRDRIESFGFADYLTSPGLITLEPFGYLDFLCLTSQAKAIVTDSGGLQEEATALGVPCLILRPNTERPITCEVGSGVLVGDSAELLWSTFSALMNGHLKAGQCPELWDGKAARRIAEVLSGSQAQLLNQYTCSRSS